jgi:hypothetical protein
MVGTSAIVCCDPRLALRAFRRSLTARRNCVNFLITRVRFSDRVLAFFIVFSCSALRREHTANFVERVAQLAINFSGAMLYLH